MFRNPNKPKYPSFEGWSADIDTAVILELNSRRRVTGIRWETGLSLSAHPELYKEGGFNRNPDHCRVYQAMVDRVPEETGGWDLVFEVSAEEANRERVKANTHGSMQGARNLIVLVLVFLWMISLAEGLLRQWPFATLMASGILMVLVILDRGDSSFVRSGAPLWHFKVADRLSWVGLLSLLGGCMAWWVL